MPDLLGKENYPVEALPLRALLLEKKKQFISRKTRNYLALKYVIMEPS